MTHCDGCDAPQPTTQPYVARFDGIDGWMRVHYCDPCADLARINWNGETRAILSVAEVEHTAARAAAHCGPGFGRRIRTRYNVGGPHA